MKPLRIIGIVLTFILVAFAVAPGLHAQEGVWNKKTVMNFAAPFEVPGGLTLPAGTYVFKLYDSMSDRNIVQIFNQDETHIYATVLAIADYRVKRTGDTVVTFAERAAGTPVAIKEWFHPNSQFGHEFVYPKARAVELAKLENEPVPAITTELPITESAQAPLVALEKAPVAVEQPSGTETTIAEAFPPPAPEAKALPKTASEMPLLGLLGMIFVATGFALRLAVKRVS